MSLSVQEGRTRRGRMLMFGFSATTDSPGVPSGDGYPPGAKTG